MTRTGMGNGEPKRWRGLLADESKAARRTIAVILCVLVISMAAAQTGFFPLGDTHVLLLLAPVALASILLGKWQGCAIGALAGFAEMIHARYLPYDYAEMYFNSPVNSIALFALFGLIIGALLAFACRMAPRRPACEEGETSSSAARIAALMGTSAVGAIFVTTFLETSISFLNALLSVQLPAEMAAQLLSLESSLLQAVFDFVVVGFTLAIADFAVPRLSRVGHKRNLSVTFQLWLGAVTVAIFAMASGLSFVTITILDLESMNAALSEHVEFLSAELEKRDRTMIAVDEGMTLSNEERRSFEVLIYDSIECDLAGSQEDVVAVANNDDIFSTNVESLKNSSFSELLERGLVGKSPEEVLASGETALYHQGEGADISYLKAADVRYEYVDELGNLQTGSYQIMASATAHETFLNRWLFTLLVAIVFVALLGAVFIIALKLLDRFVVHPINVTNGALAQITAGNLGERVADDDSIEFSSLSTGINATVDALERSIAEANARLDRELATARAIQESALPSAQPPFPHIDAFDLYATMDPAREVGGDFYDFFELSTGRIGFVVADVSGKGIPAALFMMAAMTEIRSAVEANCDLAEAIGAANRSLCKGNDADMFVTAFAGVFDYWTGKLTYVNAGHNKPLVMHGGTWSWLTDRSGPYLGSFDWIEYRQFETGLVPNDMLFVYTDGVTEAFNLEEKMYGNARLEAFLSTHDELHPRRLLRAVRTDLIGWANGTEQSDDITMLALKFGIPPEHGSSLVTEAKLENFAQVERFLTHQLEECGCPQKVANQVLLAVEELIVNICNYAYPDAPDESPGPLRVHFTWQSQQNTIVVEIGDDGVPFNPLAQDDPEPPASIEEAKIGGLGLFLVKKTMDEVEYVREGIANVTIITKRWE